MRSLSSGTRILCLWFPDWPIQRLVARDGELHQTLLLLTETTSRGEFVRYQNPLARRRGIRAGMPLAEAESLAYARDVQKTLPCQPQEDAKALGKLAQRCERFSYRIGLEEQTPPECLLMEVTGIAHFFAGEESLADQLGQMLERWRLEGRIAIADTIGGAWAAAHFLAQPRRPIVLPPGEQACWQSLPIEGLRLEPAIVGKLHRLGLKTIGQLMALERAALNSRFGPQVLRRLDQLTGTAQELITPWRAPPRFQAEQRFEFGLSHPAAIEQVASQLLARILKQLEPRRWGLRHLQCRFTLENRLSREITLRLCAAMADASRLMGLLRTKLEQVLWDSPVMRFEMEALEITALAVSQSDLWRDGSHEHAAQLYDLLNRLSTHLGEEQVLYPRPVADPIPERAIHLVPVHTTHIASQKTLTFQKTLLPLDRPTVLFPEPRKVEVIALMPEGPPVLMYWRGTRLEIASHWGPERIESAWWRKTYVRREYYRIETTTGRRLWLFRRLQDQQWFWHGEMI